jgi:hydrogenase expression/formation protein HypE
MRKGLDLGMHRIDSGDVLLINGPIAEHGLAVMSAREGLSFETDLRSDVAPLNGLIAALLDADLDIKFMRDATRSGLAGIAADLCETTKLGIELDESAIPLTRVAHHTAELLGLDPLTVANEGKVVVVVPAARAESAISVMKRHPRGRNAMMIGRCSESDVPLVELITRAGGRRIVQRPYGEELPRIC